MPRPSRAGRRGDFHFITSMIWVPIGNSGLNDPNGSCGMKVMLRPRIPSATWRAGRRNRSSPRKRIVPPGHAGLPNEAHDLARPDGEIDAVEDPGGAVPGGIRDEEVFDLDEITGRRPHVESADRERRAIRPRED